MADRVCIEAIFMGRSGAARAVSDSRPSVSIRWKEHAMVIRRFGFVGVWFFLFGAATGAEPGGYVIDPPDVVRVVIDEVPPGASLVSGESRVGPDGVISLGDRGSMYVAGLTLDQAKAAIANKLKAQARADNRIRVQVDLVEPNSKVCYVVYPAKDGETVHRISAAGKPTVASAILQIEGLASIATAGNVSISRPSGAAEQIREVDWRAITQEGKLATNYVLEPGDRVFVRGATSPSHAGPRSRRSPNERTSGMRAEERFRIVF